MTAHKTTRSKRKKQVAHVLGKRSVKKDARFGIIPVYDTKGKEVEAFTLDEKIFNGEINTGALYQAVVMYNANKRAGSASTKTISHVRGGGRKPWRQKGTGRARVSTIRSPLWRGGGVIFGPHPRDYYYRIPKSAKRTALLSSLHAKIQDNKLIGIEEVALKEPKTKEFKGIMDSLKVKRKALVILDVIDEKVRRASRNLADVSVKHLAAFNALDVLSCDTVVISKKALQELSGRVKG